MKTSQSLLCATVGTALLLTVSLVRGAAPSTPPVPPPALLLSDVKRQADGSPDAAELMTRITTVGIVAYFLDGSTLNAQGGLEAVRPITDRITRDSTVASAIALAMSQPSSSDKIKQGSYEARLLQDHGPLSAGPGGVKGVGVIFQVLWLKSATGGADLIFVFKNTPHGVDWPKLYTAREYLAAKGETFPISGTALDNNGQPLANTLLTFRVEQVGSVRAATNAAGAFTVHLPRIWENATSISIVAVGEAQSHSEAQLLKLVRGQETKLAEPLRLRPPATPAAKTTDTPPTSALNGSPANSPSPATKTAPKTGL